jgi:hypothetical protein
VVIVKTTISVALIAVAHSITITAFLQQIAKKLGVHAALKGTGNIVVSVASGILIWITTNVMTLIVMASTTIHSNPHRYSITNQRNQVRLSLASS